MDDDLNTADAISAIFELVKFANTNANDASSGAFVTALKKEIVALSCNQRCRNIIGGW